MQKTLDHQVKKDDAYYDKEEFQNDDEQSSYKLKIRIPSEKFETFIEAILPIFRPYFLGFQYNFYYL